uniref:Bombyxin C-1 n=1 Tax=Hemiscolopendra marginata TaxID=943146 RepID=A0A646QDY2_9MYRI
MTSSQMYLTLLVAVFTMALLSFAASEEDDLDLQELLSPHEIAIRSGNRRYCGSRLSDALEAVCKGEYQKPTNLKRMSIGRYLGLRRNSDSDWSFSSPDFSDTIFTNRQLRGVVDECCKNPCSYRQLTSYCAVPRSEQQ